MKIQVLLIILIVSLIKICKQVELKCHYSCDTCVGSSYNQCAKCISDKNITIVEDPQISQKQYINSNIVSGVCTGQLSPRANALGILLLLICAGIAIAIRTPYSIYLISTLQTLSLIGFVEIAWVNPVGYLWQALQYFMIFTWLGSGFKVQDQSMRQRQYYRLDVYFRESTFLRNFAIIGIINLLLIILIIIFGVIKYKKDKQQKQNRLVQLISQKSKRAEQKTENNLQLGENPVISSHKQNQVPNIQNQYQYKETICQKIIQITHKASLTMFLLLIQQSCLIILVSLRFQRPMSLAVKGLSIIYCFCLLCFLIYIFIFKLWIFPNIQAQFSNIWRKIGLPVLVIVPYQITFLIVVFLLIFYILEGFFQYRNNGYKLISRISLYKLIELVVIILSGAYIITQLNRNIQVSTNIIRVFLAIGILSFFVCFVVETVFGAIQTYCIKNNNQIANSVKDQAQNVNQLNHTQQAINDGNIFDPNKNKIVIQDIEDQQNKGNQKGQLDNLKLKEQQKRKKEQQQLQNIRKMRQQQERKKRQEQETKRIQEERKKRQQQERKKRQEQQRKRLQQQQKKKRQELQKKRRQQEERRLKNEQQKKRRQQQQRLRKQQEARKKRQQEEARKKQLQQQARIKKLQQQQARKRKLEEQARRKKQDQQQMARRKKQQEQEQQQQKQRRKRKYMSQMDPELRKRYGL